MVCDPVAGSTVTSAKLKRPDQRIHRTAFELQPDRRRVARDLAGEHLLAQPQQIGAGLLDVDVDRVEPLDGGQGIVLRRPGPARRWYKASGRCGPEIGARIGGPAKVDLGRAQGGGLGLDVGARLAGGGQGVVVQLARDEVALDQLGIARDLALGGDGRRPCPGERGAGVGDARFIGGRIDAVERLAGADDNRPR